MNDKPDKPDKPRGRDRADVVRGHRKTDATHMCEPPDQPNPSMRWHCPQCKQDWRAAADPPTDPPLVRWYRE